jgi:hypothetical protein
VRGRAKEQGGSTGRPAFRETAAAAQGTGEQRGCQRKKKGGEGCQALVCKLQKLQGPECKDKFPTVTEF